MHKQRIYYESPDYESESQPGSFARIQIIGDDDGPHLVFSSDNEIILDLPIPVCEALDIRTGLGESVKDVITAAERLTDLPERLTGIWEPEADSDSLPPADPRLALPEAIPHEHVEHQPPAVAPQAAMTPYGRREIGPGEWPLVGYPPPDVPVASGPRWTEAAGEPPINHTRPLPCPSGSRLRRAG